MSFNYVEATDEEMLAHIEKASAASVSMIKAYHESKGNVDIVARINACREVLKRRRMAEKLAKLLET